MPVHYNILGKKFKSDQSRGVENKDSRHVKCNIDPVDWTTFSSGKVLTTGKCIELSDD